MTNESRQKLEAIFRAVFELPPGSDLAGLQSGQTAAWDSLATVSLVAAIETEFGLSLEADQMLRITSYAETAKLLEELTG
jgi:acyl carrier protein